MTTPEEYLGNVQATAWRAEEYLSSAAMSQVTSLIQGGEPGEAMNTLGWVISNEKAKVPRAIIDDLKRLSQEIVPLDELPDDLDSYAMD